MASSVSDLNERYASAAPRWSDKMRVLGYYDGYLGFLSHLPRKDISRADVIDVGCGTGAMAEAFVAVNGAPRSLTLLDPAGDMIAYAQGALNARGVEAEIDQALLDEQTSGTYDVALAAHVIEHFSEPSDALSHLRRICRPGARLWLSVSKPHWCSILIWLKWRHRTFSKPEINDLLQSVGFEVEHIYDFPSGPPSRTSFGIVARAV